MKQHNIPISFIFICLSVIIFGACVKVANLTEDTYSNIEDSEERLWIEHITIDDTTEPITIDETVYITEQTIIHTTEKLTTVNTTEKNIEFNVITMPLTDEIFTTNEPVTEPKYGFTDDDIYLLAQLLCGSESIDGDGEYDFVYDAINFPDKLNYYEISKVLCVVTNRIFDKTDDFPDTVREVCLQKGQFVVFPKNLDKVPAQIAIDKVRDWCEAFDRWDRGAQSIPEDHYWYEAGKDNHTGAPANITRNYWRK